MGGLFYYIQKLALWLLAGLLLLPLSGYGQSTNAPLTEEYYQLLDRFEIKQPRFSESFYTNFKPI